MIAFVLALVLHVAPADGVVVVPDGSVSESTWQCLREHGATGRAGDGMEALYVSPSLLSRCTIASQPSVR